MDTKKYFLAASIAAGTLIIIAAAFFFFKPKPPAPAIEGAPPRITHPWKKPYKGTIAIVIDDLGYNSTNLDIYAQIRQPLTVSVLPNLQFSAQVSETLHKRFEVILHLPMEPKGTPDIEKDTILAGMKAEEIRAIVNADLDNLKYAKGVSNHMGSKATEDPATMDQVCAVLKQRSIYWLDSFVTTKTAGIASARAAGIRSARRDIFLDNRKEGDYIRQQLGKLKAQAAKAGYAIGIGHDRKITLETLRDELPRIAAEGYKFVFVSALAQKAR